MRKFKTYIEASKYAKTLAEKSGKSVAVKSVEDDFIVDDDFEYVNVPNKFCDKRLFPHGFARSGDFTLKQAKILEESGAKVLYIQRGIIQSMSDEHITEFKRLFGNEALEAGLVTAWNKYEEIATRKGIRMFNGKGGYISGPDGDPTGHSDIVPRGSLTKRHK